MIVAGVLFVAASFFMEAPAGADGAFEWTSGATLILLGLFVWIEDLQRKNPSVAARVFARWLRGGLFAFIFACFAQWWMTSDAPTATVGFGKLWLLGGLVWLLFDTTRTWLLISALSRADQPMFPRFVEASEAGWPNQPRYMALREILRKEEWAPTLFLRADDPEGMGGVQLRVYLSQDKRVRLHLYFILLPTGAVSWAGLLESWTKDDQRLVTDNFFLPCGGFYPENWHVKRAVWRRSLETLEKLHRRRMDEAGADWRELEGCTAAEIAAQQRAVEQVNLGMGFLTPPQEREEAGSLTSAGRYLLWKEVLLLNYFGIAGGR